MRILVVEDEPPVAEYIEEMCHAILGKKLKSIHCFHSLPSANNYLSENPVDLCLLDLNLNGKNGFEILENSLAGAFHTIIISAYTDQAVRAFEYGVLDFVPKPFDEQRLRMAFNRYHDRNFKKELATKYLSVRDGSKIRIVKLEQVLYFKAADNYVEAFLKNGKRELLDKPLYRLLQILPSNFIQIHRSYVLDLNLIQSFGHAGQGAYCVELKNSACLPLSRGKYKELKSLFQT